MRRDGAVRSKKILLFSKTAAFRHASVPEGIGMIRDCAHDAGVAVHATEDTSEFTDANLAAYDAVVWLQVTGDVLDLAERAAFDRYLRGGGGFAGIHATSDAERSWPEFEEIVGARFKCHPIAKVRQVASVVVEADDPSTGFLPDQWSWLEEWYSFETNPRDGVEILLTVDEETYDPEGSSMGDDHPVCWRGTYGEGRTWYSALGHIPESYADAVFRDHLWAGITSVMRTT